MLRKVAALMELKGVRGEGEPGAFWKRTGGGRQTVVRVVQ